MTDLIDNKRKIFPITAPPTPRNIRETRENSEHYNPTSTEPRFSEKKNKQSKKLKRGRRCHGRFIKSITDSPAHMTRRNTTRLRGKVWKTPKAPNVKASRWISTATRFTCFRAAFPLAIKSKCWVICLAVHRHDSRLGCGLRLLVFHMCRRSQHSGTSIDFPCEGVALSCPSSCGINAVKRL